MRWNIRTTKISIFPESCTSNEQMNGITERIIMSLEILNQRGIETVDPGVRGMGTRMVFETVILESFQVFDMRLF